VSELADRKRDHLRIVLGEAVGHDGAQTGLDRLRVRPCALPERDLDAVDLRQWLWGRELAAPLLLSCMTGGVGEAGPVNRALAAAAQAHGVALGLGSGRVLLEDPDAVASFRVRDRAPDVLLLATLGAVQLHEHGPEACARLLELCAADGLVLHVNAVQEAVQRGGDTAFGDLLPRIARLCAALPAPVMVKEVGFGIAAEDVRRLVEAVVAGIDVAGAGGTNWARVEGHRDARAAAVAAAFGAWGLPTAAAILEARAVLERAGAGDVVLVGSGGLRHGVDALKALCLGADVVGFARTVLAAGAQGPETAIETVGVLVEQLRIGAWAAGAGRLCDLGRERLDPA
jgi:isopentenyl-diphosphate Delta-isomerase